MSLTPQRNSSPLIGSKKVKAKATITFTEPTLSKPLLHVEDTCTKLDFSTLQIISVREGLPPQVQTKKMTKKRATSQALIDKRIDFYLTKTHYRKESSASEADESSSSTLRTQLEEVKLALLKAQQQITILLAERGTLSQTIEYLQNQLSFVQHQVTGLNILYPKLEVQMKELNDQVNMYLSVPNTELTPVEYGPFSGIGEVEEDLT